jgi:hypothetical protein
MSTKPVDNVREIGSSVLTFPNAKLPVEDSSEPDFEATAPESNVISFPLTPGEVKEEQGLLEAPANIEQAEQIFTAAEVADAESARLRAESDAAREAAVAAQIPLEKQKYTVSGTLATGHSKPIVQEFEINVPVGMPNHDQASLFIWQALMQQGGLTVKENDKFYKLYPFAAFGVNPLELKVGIVTGVKFGVPAQ